MYNVSISTRETLFNFIGTLANFSNLSSEKKRIELYKTKSSQFKLKDEGEGHTKRGQMFAPKPKQRENIERVWN